MHSNKNPYPEPAVPEQDGQSSFARPEVNKRVRAEGPEISRPDIKSNRKNDDGSDGAPSYPVSYNTFQHSYYREFRHRRPHHHTRYKQHAYSYRVHDLPDGRQLITLYHNDHEVGLCGDCFNTTATLTKNGKLRVRPRQGDIDCCSCAIL